MISTSSYKDFNTDLYSTVSISGDGGRSTSYYGKTYKKLAPKKDFWKKWHDNIGRISDEENTRYYIEEYYKQVLSNLDPAVVYDELNYKTLLCYEESSGFCHRHVVAAWFNLLLGDTIEPVIELAIKDGVITRVDDVSSKYSEILEDVIRKNEKMYGFTSVRARYLFDKGEQLERLADDVEKDNPGKAYRLRQSACYFRCDADMAEDEYRVAQYKKAKGE